MINFCILLCIIWLCGQVLPSLTKKRAAQPTTKAMMHKVGQAKEGQAA